jgi:16S rRNA processing protein RimM
MRLVVARVGRAHGIHGEVTIELRTDVPDRRFRPGVELFTVAPARSATPVPTTLTLRSVRDHNGVLLLSFEGIDDRNAAEDLRGLMFEVEIDEDEQEPDAWYDHQLIGLAAVDPVGEPLGEVVAVEHPGAQDRLIVRRPDGVLRMVPFVTAIVPTVDVRGGRVVIDAPAGLIEDAED